MTTQEIHSKLATIISQKVNKSIGVQQVKLDSRLREDLGIDSLAVTEMLFEIEEVFGTVLEVSHAEALLTVGDAVRAIAVQLATVQPAA